MKSTISRIKEGLKYLSEKDQKLCETFLDLRQIDSIKEIVDSTIIKINRNIKIDNNLQCEDNLENLNILKSIVDFYYKACGYEDDSFMKEDLEIEDDEGYYGEC